MFVLGDNKLSVQVLFLLRNCKLKYAVEITWPSTTLCGLLETWLLDQLFIEEADLFGCLLWNIMAVNTAWIKGEGPTIWFLAIIYFGSGVPRGYVVSLSLSRNEILVFVVESLHL